MVGAAEKPGLRTRSISRSDLGSIKLAGLILMLSRAFTDEGPVPPEGRFGYDHASYFCPDGRLSAGCRACRLPSGCELCRRPGREDWDQSLAYWRGCGVSGAGPQ